MSATTSTRATVLGALIEFDPEQFELPSVRDVLETVGLDPLTEILARPGYGTPYTPAIIRLSRVESGGGDHPNAAWVTRLAGALLRAKRIDNAGGDVRVDVHWRRFRGGRPVDFTLQIPPHALLANLDEALQIVSDAAHRGSASVPTVVASLTDRGSVSVLRGAA